MSSVLTVSYFMQTKLFKYAEILKNITMSEKSSINILSIFFASIITKYFFVSKKEYAAGILFYVFSNSCCLIFVFLILTINSLDLFTNKLGFIFEFLNLVIHFVNKGVTLFA